ncbi:MAG TPA: TonB-dependent receptor plug domain-containing protein [Thermoanaerobaculia bacterium]|nr:TonB-dependent receptor plug domain-containing protein [Thermoanaerobaculia bacterium]
MRWKALVLGHNVIAVGFWVLLLAAAVPGWAQTAGRITGQVVKGLNGEPVPGAEVQLERAEAATSTEAALLTERKAAAQISDAIGAEEIGKNTGSDAAGVLKRVTGVSLQDDKFVFVRGLGERYSNTTLNGSKLPSTEFERKVVPLDLFPADLLEKITVSKSYTAAGPTGPPSSPATAPTAASSWAWPTPPASGPSTAAGCASSTATPVGST